MISQIFWLVPNRVLYWKLSGEIPGSEIEDMSQFIARQVDKTSKQKMHIVINAVGISNLEYKSQIAQNAFVGLAKNQWLGQIVTIIHNYQIQIQLNVLSRAFGLNWHNVSSMDDAIRILKNADSSLQAIPKTPEKYPIPRPNMEQSS